MRLQKKVMNRVRISNMENYFATVYAKWKASLENVLLSYGRTH